MRLTISLLALILACALGLGLGSYEAFAEERPKEQTNIVVWGDVDGDRAKVSVDQVQTKPGTGSGTNGRVSYGGSPGGSQAAGSAAGNGVEKLVPEMFCLPFGTPESDPCLRRNLTDPPPGAAPVVDPQVVAREAALELQVPKPVPVIGPDPSANRWNLIPIGMPVWVGDARPTSAVSEQVTSQGIGIAMEASRTSTLVDFGDGTRITCSSMTVRPQGTLPTTPSPDCGHTYTTPGRYTITVTSQWQVTWAAAGQTGVVPLTAGSSTTLDVGEIGTVLVP